ncbi:hypothetical protein SAMN04488074_12875 [Lentzea albidocapillata subsp. violacea]|uniref:Uncharacterized protein n=1 Tax=Lentzea albidocapillata subsp. violacea TaxID=128104 RepID=A0A1G9WT81_9PSEU|nr:hypothetical protein SAMN04488074_12875 [Lentzea albidocapillata subsp. violacea]
MAGRKALSASTSPGIGVCAAKALILLRRSRFLRSAAAAVAEAKWPPVAISMVMRPPRAATLMTSVAVSQEPSMRALSAAVTARVRWSARKIPGTPVVPEVVVTV